MDNEQPVARALDTLLARSLNGDTTPDEEAEVLAWRRASEDHETEYRHLATLLEWSARLPELVAVPPRPAAAELIAASERRATVVPLGRRVMRRRPYWLAAAAAAAGILLVGSLVPRLRFVDRSAPAIGIRDVVTSEEETTTLELLDGTVVRLAPASRLRTLESRHNREVRLEGRAFFAVAKRNGMPFVIRTDAGAVTVLGTRFDVQARGQDLRLVVLEGRVALTTPRQRTELVAGELGRIRNGEAAPVERVADVAPFVQWAGRFLAFQSTPLRDAAREIERVYNVRIVIEGDDLERRVITAWFRDKSLSEVLDVVCLAVAAQCTVADGEVRIRADSAASAAGSPRRS